MSASSKALMVPLFTESATEECSLARPAFGLLQGPSAQCTPAEYHLSRLYTAVYVYTRQTRSQNGESCMRRRHRGSMLLLVMLCSLYFAASGSAADMVKLKGSGASFPFPLYGRWFKDYGKVNKHVQVDYQAKGSGAGIKDFVNKTVDFAASD